jgi:hypothetical protein
MKYHILKMPTIPRTDFYLNFDKQKPSLIWIDSSDLGDSEIPNPIFSDDERQNFHWWNNLWFPRVAAILQQANVPHGAPMPLFITDNADLLKSYQKYSRHGNSPPDLIQMNTGNREHPDREHMPYRMIYTKFQDAQYYQDQHRLLQSTHTRQSSNSPMPPQYPHAQLPHHQGELQQQQHDHAYQSLMYQHQLGQNPGISRENHGVYMNQLHSFQQADRARMLQRHQAEYHNINQNGYGR